MSERLPPLRPPVDPALHTPGYVAGWAGYGNLRAWGLTPESARRRWNRKNRRLERRTKRARDAG